MNKKLLAIAVATAAVAVPAQAVDLYDKDGATFSMGGHVSANISDPGAGEIGVGTNSPRINFNATQDIGNGFTADAKGEWALNFLNGGANSFTTRLGYVGVTHDTVGRFALGTQWSPYYDVAGVADMPIAYATDYLYNDHGNLGTGRANNQFSYRKTFMLGSFGLNLGLGWQGEQATYDSRYQLALSGDIAMIKLGYTMSSGDINGNDGMHNAVSAKYGAYGDGIYVAGVYGFGDQLDGIAEFSAIELIGAYGLDNGLNLILNYESLEDDAQSETQISEVALQAEYFVTPKFATYAAYQIDLGDDISGDDNKWTLGARFYL